MRNSLLLLTVDKAGGDRTVSFHSRVQILYLNDELERMICFGEELEARISDEQLTVQLVKEALAEMFPPNMLFDTTTQKFYN